MTIRQRIGTLLSGASLGPNTLGTVRSVLTDKLTFGRKILSAAVGLAAIAGPAGLGLRGAQQSSAQSPQTIAVPPPSFEVASIKPSRSGENGVRLMMSRDRFNTTNLATKELIEFAYDAKDDQLSGGPSWINSEKYDIDAKEEDSVVERLQKLPFEQQTEQVRLMVQSLLADRFKLKVSHQTKELPIYELVVAKNGHKLTQTPSPPPGPPGTQPPGPQSFHGIRMSGKGQLSGNEVPISLLAEVLTRQTEIGGRLVLDKTGLKGNYDWALKWTPDESAPMFKGAGDGTQGPGSQGPGNTPPTDSSGPSLFAAIQEQLGLKLEPQKAPVDVLVIEHIEKPSEN
jgi:uncharacterized protein (TIGR03435 family)